jgi:hypothetical protein
LRFSHKILATARPTVPKPISATPEAELGCWRWGVGGFAIGFETRFGNESVSLRKTIPYHTCAARFSGTANHDVRAAAQAE